MKRARSFLSGFGELRPPRDTSEVVRPARQGMHFGLSSSHYLATEAGAAAFRRGGNAVDAGVAAGIALSVVEPHMCTFGGIAPAMVLPAGASEPVVIDGVGTWPRGIDLPEYRELFGADLPIGVERSVIPGAPAAWLTALERFGSLSLADVLEPALELCRDGVVVSPGLASFCVTYCDRFAGWPSSAAVFAPDGVPLRVGEVFVQHELASVFERLLGAEERARAAGLSRAAGVEAARAEFYAGQVAEDMARFMQALDWPLTARDLREFEIGVEAPVSSTYRGLSVYATGPWSQGPMLPMLLNILEGFDLARLSDAEFWHVFVEAFKLVGADREAYFADPRLVDVPIDGLLSKDYAAQRRALIGERACARLPDPGRPWPWSALTPPPEAPLRPSPTAGARPPDTAHVVAGDAAGTMFSALPSDHVFGSPLVPGCGFPVSHRGAQFWLDARHPSSLAPGKRPRITPNPAMIMRDGRPLLAFGSPGEDLQCQAMAQFVRAFVDRRLRVQEAVEAPRVASLALPSSFFPHAHSTPRVGLESRADPAVFDSLRERGHAVSELPAYSYGTGAVGAVVIPGADRLTAVSDPRRPDSSTVAG